MHNLKALGLTGLQLGIGQGQTTNAFDGRLCEVIAVNATPTTQQRSDLFDYMSGLYAITVGA